MCLNRGCNAEPSKVERIEEASHSLRGTFAEELANDSPTFDGANATVIELHGVSQRAAFAAERERRVGFGDGYDRTGMDALPVRFQVEEATA